LRLPQAAGRLIGTSLATLVILGAIGVAPTRAMAGAGGTAAMLAGLAAALAGSWAGLVPTLAYLHRPAQQHATGILGGLAVRFAVTIGLAVAVWLVGAVAEKPFLLWVGIGQLVVLGVDVWGLTGLLRKAAEDAT